MVIATKKMYTIFVYFIIKLLQMVKHNIKKSINMLKK